MLYTITDVIPEPSYRLRLTYSDGAVIVVNLQSLIEQGGVFTALVDPQFFAQVTLGERGRYIEWNGAIDILRRCVAAGRVLCPRTRKHRFLTHSSLSHHLTP